MSYTLDNEVLLLFNGTMEINISVIAVCIFFDKLKIIIKTFLHLTLHLENWPILRVVHGAKSPS